MLLQVQISDMCPIIVFFFLLILFLLTFLDTVNTNSLLQCDNVQWDFSNWMEPKTKKQFFLVIIILILVIIWNIPLIYDHLFPLYIRQVLAQLY